VWHSVAGYVVSDVWKDQSLLRRQLTPEDDDTTTVRHSITSLKSGIFYYTTTCNPKLVNPRDFSEEYLQQFCNIYRVDRTRVLRMVLEINFKQNRPTCRSRTRWFNQVPDDVYKMWKKFWKKIHNGKCWKEKQRWTVYLECVYNSNSGRMRTGEADTWTIWFHLQQLTFLKYILSLYFSIFQALREVRFDFRLTDWTRFRFIVRFIVSDSGISLRASLKEKTNRLT
jgi:hypothetical protein